METYNKDRLMLAARLTGGVPNPLDQGRTREVGTMVFEAEAFDPLDLGPPPTDPLEVGQGELSVSFFEDNSLATEPGGRHLFVRFESVFGGYESREFMEAGGVRKFDHLTINGSMFDLYCRTAPLIFEQISKVMMDAIEVDERPFTHTTYMGAGIGGALAVMVATQCPPNALYTFGTPPFANRRLTRDIETAVNSREQKMAARSLEPTPFEFIAVEDMNDRAVGSIASRPPLRRQGTVLLATDSGNVLRPSLARRMWERRKTHPHDVEWTSYYYYSLYAGTMLDDDE